MSRKKCAPAAAALLQLTRRRASALKSKSQPADEHTPAESHAPWSQAQQSDEAQENFESAAAGDGLDDGSLSGNALDVEVDKAELAALEAELGAAGDVAADGDVAFPR